MLLFFVIPLCWVILLNLPYKKLNQNLALYGAMTITFLQMVIAVALKYVDNKFTKSLYDIFRLSGKVNFIKDFNDNSYSFLMILTIGLIAFVTLIIGTNSESKFKFANLLLIIVMGMNGVVLVTDLFSLYVFLEITAVTTFILIAMHKDINSLEGSFKYFIMSTIATILILTSIAIIFMSIGSLKFDDVGKYIFEGHHKFALPALIALTLFICGVFIKGGTVPFHTWVPDAYTSASASVSVLLSGIITKVAGVYVLLAFFKIAVDAGNLENKALAGKILMIFGTISIIVGALAAIGQNDFKRMLAYSSISQIGYIILGIGIGSNMALFGAVYHFFNHAAFKSLLFVNSAAVEEQTGIRRLDKLGGLAAKMPITGWTSIIGFLSAAGIPPLSGFWSKLIIIVAAWMAGFHYFATIALLGSILTIGYFLILQRKAFFGNVTKGMETVVEAGAKYKFTSILLALINVVVGVVFMVYYLLDKIKF